MKKRIVAESDFYSCDVIVDEKKIKSTLELLVQFCKRQREKFVNKDKVFETIGEVNWENRVKSNQNKLKNTRLWSEKIQLTVNIYPID